MESTLLSFPLFTFKKTPSRASALITQRLISEQRSDRKRFDLMLFGGKDKFSDDKIQYYNKISKSFSESAIKLHSRVQKIFIVHETNHLMF